MKYERLFLGLTPSGLSVAEAKGVRLEFLQSESCVLTFFLFLLDCSNGCVDFVVVFGEIVKVSLEFVLDLDLSLSLVLGLGLGYV